MADRIAQTTAAVVKAVEAGLYQAGIDIMYQSQIEVPVDTGTLKASARVMEPETFGTTVTVTLGYGYGEELNPKTGERAIQYAIPVHERMEVRHEPPTKAKFLEDPALVYEPFLGPTLALWITRAVKEQGAFGYLMSRIEPSEAVLNRA